MQVMHGLRMGASALVLGVAHLAQTAGIVSVHGMTRVVKEKVASHLPPQPSSRSGVVERLGTAHNTYISVLRFSWNESETLNTDASGKNSRSTALEHQHQHQHQHRRKKASRHRNTAGHACSADHRSHTIGESGTVVFVYHVRRRRHRAANWAPFRPIAILADPRHQDRHRITSQQQH